MPRWSPRWRTSGSSRSTGRTRSSGRSSSPHRRCRCGTSYGRRRNPNGTYKEDLMARWKARFSVLPAAALAASIWLAAPRDAAAFCGFYVGKADASLYNQASQVVLVRNANRTVISMMNDYQGELSEFALVVPVPVVLEKRQIHIGDRDIIKHLAAYSAPRLLHDPGPDPCLGAEKGA